MATQHSIHSELDWVAAIVKSGSVEHSVTFKIYDIQAASAGPIHASLSIKLAKGHTYRDFSTKVDGKALEPGVGFNGEDYVLPLTLVKENTQNKGAPTVTVSFRETGASRRLLGAHLYELSHSPIAFRSSAMLVIKADVPITRPRRLLWAILSRLLRQQGPQLLPVGWEPDTTGEFGVLQRSLGDDFPKTLVAYALPAISWPDLVAGIVTFILGATAGFGLAKLFELWASRPPG